MESNGMQYSSSHEHSKPYGPMNPNKNGDTETEDEDIYEYDEEAEEEDIEE